jgi:hypothetical protein
VNSSLQNIHQRADQAVRTTEPKRRYEMIRPIFVAAVVATSALLLSGPLMAQAGGARDYEVTITNVTKGQSFTPVLAVTHKTDIALFTVGEPASSELAILAESGNIAPLQGLLESFPESVLDTNTNGALLMPGDSVTIPITGSVHYDHLSFAAMLIPTNDSFVAVNSLALPKKGSTSLYAWAFDAGSEINDELCANIPGPFCMGEGASPSEDGEGYVFIANGVHGVGDLDEAEFDWNNPVAYVVIRQVK